MALKGRSITTYLRRYRTKTPLPEMKKPIRTKALNDEHENSRREKHNDYVQAGICRPTRAV